MQTTLLWMVIIKKVIHVLNSEFCTFTGITRGNGPGLDRHRKKSVLTTNPKEEYKLESTLSQLTGWMIKRAAAESSRALSKSAVHCCHKPTLTAEFALATTYATCSCVIVCLFFSHSFCSQLQEAQQLWWWTANNRTHARSRHKNGI